jgi:hypothetical protein
VGRVVKRGDVILFRRPQYLYCNTESRQERSIWSFQLLWSMIRRFVDDVGSPEVENR